MLIAYRLLFLCNLLFISGFNLLYNIEISGGIEPPLFSTRDLPCFLYCSPLPKPRLNPYLICASNVIHLRYRFSSYEPPSPSLIYFLTLYHNLFARSAYVFAAPELLVISEWYYLFYGMLDLYSHMVRFYYNERKRYNLNLTELEVLYRYIYISY